MDPIVKNRMSIEQQLLYAIYKKTGKSTTIEELVKELNVPRSTIVFHLQSLTRDRLVTFEKEGKEKKFYPVPEVHEEVYKGLAAMRSAFVTALTQIRKKELKELQE